jgi:DNA processing protein
MDGREDIVDLLGLRLIPGVGSISWARLVEAFGSAGAALGAPRAALKRVPGLRAEVAEAVHRRAFSADPARELKRLTELGGRVVALGDPDYPPLLAGIYGPPPLLFVRGALGPVLAGGVALVGSRAMSPYGRQVAADLAQGLARAGVSVISGLARGVDAVAHAAALAAGGHTLGVMGCGLDVTYPPEHQRLMADMARKGAVASEFPLGTKPLPGNFPLRNRIISGLARAVVVVEAGIKSGSLITARHALDQGREVFAVPGPVTSTQSQGCHELLRQGARLLSSVADLLEPGALPPAPPAPVGSAVREDDRALDGLPAEAARLLELIGPQPAHVDELARAAGLRAQEVTALLVSLEMAGLVSQLPGKHYVRGGVPPLP